MKKQELKDHFNQQIIVKEFELYTKDDIFFRIIQSLIPGKKVLSLGCGSGREVKLLVKNKHKVVAIDFAENMIKESKKIEPRAKYFCMDAIDFVKKYRKKLKFDYILGLFTLLCYLKKKDRKEFIKGLYEMLNKGGQIIFTIHYYNNNLKDLIKALIAPILALWFREKYELGDAYCDLSLGCYTIVHHFTKRQLKSLFKGYYYKINGTEIRIYKNEDLNPQ
jgi:SAM-dependent methyltransferase